jgi:hypothetical protein
VAKYGKRFHELEALPPAERSDLLREAILGVMDVDAFNREKQAEAEDAARLATLKNKVMDAIADVVSDAG